MDLESACADFDSIIPAAKTIEPDASTSNPSESALPVSQTLNLATASLENTLPSHPRMSSSPPLLSRANTPMPSPATRSLPNTPPISPARSPFNSPACSPTHAHVNTAIAPTRTRVNQLPILPPEDSISVPAEEDHRAAMDSGSPTVEIGSRKSERAAKRRRDVEIDLPSKRTRSSTINATTTSGRTTTPAASTSVATRRGLRSDNEATKRGGDKAATAAAQRRSKTVGMSAPSRAELSSAIAPVEAEKNSPLWFSTTVVMLQSESAMGEERMELVRIWVSFEVRSRYEEVCKLGPKYRPSPVGEWIGRGRPGTW